MLVMPGRHVQGSPVPPCGFAPVANALLAFLLHCNQSPLLHQVVTHLDMIWFVRPQIISDYLFNQFNKYKKQNISFILEIFQKKTAAPVRVLAVRPTSVGCCHPRRVCSNRFRLQQISSCPWLLSQVAQWLPRLATDLHVHSRWKYRSNQSVELLEIAWRSKGWNKREGQPACFQWWSDDASLAFQGHPMH